MIKLYIETNYDNDIIKSYLPKFIKRLILDDLPKYKYHNDYLIKNYNVTLKELTELFYKNIKWDKYGNQYIIYLDNNKYYKNHNLTKLIDIVNYGDINIKGINIFNNAFKYVEQNLSTIYSFYVMLEGN